MLKRYLQQPYPFRFNKWRLLLSISFFIGLFIVVFQPFGLSKVNGTHRTAFLLGYGLVTFVVLFINLMVVQNLFKGFFSSERWTVFKQITWLSWIVFSIGVGNYIYTTLFLHQWSWYAFVLFQFFTFVIALFPIVTLTIVNQNRLLAQNLQLAHEFNQSISHQTQQPESDYVKLVADNEKDYVSLRMSDLLYIESVGNYVELYYLKDMEVQRTILRSTLKRLETQLEPYSTVLKCHRAFLVNVSNVSEVKGNSQGLRLLLKHSDVEIPVSRSMSKNLKSALNLL